MSYCLKCRQPLGTCICAKAKDELITRAEFYDELKALGERMAGDGKIVIKQLLHEAETNGRSKCQFDNWPEHLQKDAFRRLGLEPVTMYRRFAPSGEVGK